MRPWQILFREAKRESEAQGASTGFDDDFANEAEDDALADEGEAEIEEEGDDTGEEPESEDDEEEESEEEEGFDDEEEEGEKEELEEEEEPQGFKFKDPKTGDFDFKRINKAVGGDELEKAFKEQNATITRNFQELKSYKDIGTPQDLTTFRNKAGFLDNLIDTDPVIQSRVIEILNGGGQNPSPYGGHNPQASQIPQGVDPNDPVWLALQPTLQSFQAIQNRLAMADRRERQAEQDRKFSQGLDGAKARFKELTKRDMTPEQVAKIEQEMRGSGYLNGANLVPALFQKEIHEVMSRKVVEKRVVKKNLPKSGSSRRPAPTAKKRSKEEEREDLWNRHMGDGSED